MLKWKAIRTPFANWTSWLQTYICNLNRRFLRKLNFAPCRRIHLKLNVILLSGKLPKIYLCKLHIEHYRYIFMSPLLLYCHMFKTNNSLFLATFFPNRWKIMIEMSAFKLDSIFHFRYWWCKNKNVGRKKLWIYFTRSTKKIIRHFTLEERTLSSNDDAVRLHFHS